MSSFIIENVSDVWILMIHIVWILMIHIDWFVHAVTRELSLCFLILDWWKCLHEESSCHKAASWDNKSSKIFQKDSSWMSMWNDATYTELMKTLCCKSSTMNSYRQTLQTIGLYLSCKCLLNKSDQVNIFRTLKCTNAT